MNPKEQTDVENALFLEALSCHGSFDLKVRGASMQPTLLAGDLVHLVPIDAALLYLGDVVLVFDDGLFSVHRLIGMAQQPRRYLTKGDAFERADGWVAGEKIIAKAVRGKTPAGVSFEMGTRSLNLLEKLRLFKQGLFPSSTTAFSK